MVRVFKKLIKAFLLQSIKLYLILGKKILGIEFVNRFIEGTCLTFTIPCILGWFGASIGKRVTIKGITLDNAEKDYKNLIVGDGVFIGRNCFFDLADQIILEQDVVVAGCVKILTHGDVGFRILSDYYQRKQDRVFVKKGSWIGAGAIILYGSIINELCIVAAGSVVKGNLESRWIYGGVPARKIKTINNREYKEGKY